MCEGNTVIVDGGKTVIVSRDSEAGLKVVTQRSNGRKDTFTLTVDAAKQLASVLNAQAA